MKLDIESSYNYRLQKKREKKDQLTLRLIYTQDDFEAPEGGEDSSNSQDQKEAEEKFEGIIMDIFQHLDGLNDGVLHYDEVMPLLKFFKNREQDQNSAEATFQNTFQELQTYGMLDYDEFLKFIKQLQLDEQIEMISNDLYSINFGGPIVKCICCCFKSDLKDMREQKMIERAIDLRDKQKEEAALDDSKKNQSLSEKAKSKATQTWQILSKILQAYGIAADHFSDWYLFNQIYWIGVQKEHRFDLNYKIVTIITLMSISSTFLITYSSYVHYLKESGKFEPINMAKMSCCRKILSYLSLSFFGPFIFVLIQPLEMLKGIVQLPVFIFTGQNGIMAVDFYFQHMIESLTGLHKLQLQYMVDQRKISQLFFESIPMLLMQILILMNIIPTPEIVQQGKSAIVISSVTAIISIIINFMQLSFQSRAFREPFSLYALTTLNAKQNWIPYLWQVEKRQIDRSVNYSELEIPIPGITSKIGSFQKMNFQFSDQNLLYFSNKLTFYQSQRQAQETQLEKKEEIFKPTFNIGKSLDLVCINTLLHFIHNFPFQYLNLVVEGVDWERCIKHAQQRDLISKTNTSTNLENSLIMGESGSKYIGYTQSNVPLLFVCVENEPDDPNQKWLLEDCFQQLIKNNFDTDIQNRFSEQLISFAIQNKKKKSIQILVDYVKLDFIDDKGMSLLGQAIVSNDIQAFDLISSRIEGSDFLNNTDILDTNISLKQMSLIEYFCKKCFPLCQHEDKIPEMIDKIYELMIAREYKLKKQDEIQKFFRSCAKIMSARGYLQENQRKLLQMLSKIAAINKFDIFSHVDRKNHTFGYVFCKYFCGGLDGSEELYVLQAKGLSQIHQMNSRDQLKNYSPLFSELPFEKVKDIVMNQIWEKTQANQQVSYGQKLIQKQIQINGGQLEVISLISDFLPNKKFQNAESEDQALKYLLKMSHIVYSGTNQSLWGQLTRCIFASLIVNNEQDIIKQHCEESKKLSYDKMNRTHANYRVQLDETHSKKTKQNKDQHKDDTEDQNQDQQNDDTEQQNQDQKKDDTDNTIVKGQNYTVEVSRRGQYPEFARYIKDTTQEMQIERQKQLSLKFTESDLITTDSNKRNNENIIEQLFNLVIEIVSTFDLITDLYVLKSFIHSQHNMWLAINIFSVVSPLFVCISPYINFKMEKLYTDVYLNNYFPLYRKIMCLVTFTPFIIVFFFSMDVFFLIFSGVGTLIILLIRLITCGKINNSNFTEGAIDKSFNYIFEMSKLDVAGFRRLRTISQLSFESFIQIILQIRILIYQTTNPGGVEGLGISIDAIVISLGFALLHTIIEVIFLSMEATATKTTLTHYSIICFNGRFGWVPFSHIFSDPKSVISIDKLDYENIESKFFCMNFFMDFQFTDNTMAGLTRSLCNLPLENDPLKRMTIKIGHSADNVDLSTLLNLVQVAYQRVNIDLEEVNVKEMLQNASQGFKKQLTDVEKTPNEVPLIFKLAQLDSHQIINKMLKFGAKIDFTLQDGRTIVDLVIQNNQADLMNVLINHDPKYVNNQFSIINEDKGQTKLNDCLNNYDLDILQELCLNPKVSLCHFAQFGLMQRAIQFIREGQTEKGTIILNCLYGPDRRINDFSIQIGQSQLDMQEYFNQFPKEVTLYSNRQKCTLSTEMAFKFSLIRRVILEHWTNQKFNKGKIQKELTTKYGTPESPILLDSYGLKIKNLVTVIDLLEGGHNVGNLTMNEVKELDKFVRNFNLDKDQWKYNQQSRLNDQTGYSFNVQLIGKRSSVRYLQNRDGNLQSSFDGTGGSKHDDWSYGDSITIKFPKQSFSINEYEASYHLTDQGWGGTDTSKMVAELYFKNYAQATDIRIVNRQNSEHPNFKDNYTVEYFEEQLTQQNYQMVDLYGWASELKKIWYRPCSPSMRGWEAKSDSITIRFKVNLSFSCTPSIAIKDYKNLLDGKEEKPEQELEDSLTDYSNY